MFIVYTLIIRSRNSSISASREVHFSRDVDTATE
jgi:hypothetical protein